MATYLLRKVLVAASVVVAVSFAAFVGFGLSLDPSYPLYAKPPAQAIVRAHYHLQDPIVSRYARWLVGFSHHGFGATVSTDVGGAPLDAASRSASRSGRSSCARRRSLQSSSPSRSCSSRSGASRSASSPRSGSDSVRTSASARLPISAPPCRRSCSATCWCARSAPNVAAKYVGSHFVISSTNGWFLLGPPTGGFVDWIRHLFLPAVTLSLGLIGLYSRYLRSAMAVELGRPYVTVARAKGLTERRVLLRHALRNSLVPVTALMTLELGGIVGASIAADGVFGTGGLASEFLGALGHADPFELTAIVVMSAVVVCGFTLAGDLLVGLLDPRRATSDGLSASSSASPANATASRTRTSSATGMRYSHQTEAIDGARPRLCRRRLGRIRDEAAERRALRLVVAVAEVVDGRDDRDRLADDVRRRDDDRAARVRKHVPHEDAQAGGAGCLRRLHVLVHPQRRDARSSRRARRPST